MLQLPVCGAETRLDGRRIVDSTGALSFDSVPKHLGIVGGGYIGSKLVREMFGYSDRNQFLVYVDLPAGYTLASSFLTNLPSPVTVLDVDYHHGNGTALIFSQDEGVFTLSIHGARNFPFQKCAGDYDLALPDGVGEAALRKAIDQMRVIRGGKADSAVQTFNASHKELKEAIKRSKELTQALTDRFVRDNTLRVVQKDADAVLESDITGYENRVFGFNAEQQADEKDQHPHRAGIETIHQPNGNRE